MKRWLAWRTVLMSVLISVAISLADGNLSVGFGKADITPAITKDRPVWIAGYGAGGRRPACMIRCGAERS